MENLSGTDNPDRSESKLHSVCLPQQPLPSHLCTSDQNRGSQTVTSQKNGYLRSGRSSYKQQSKERPRTSSSSPRDEDLPRTSSPKVDNENTLRSMSSPVLVNNEDLSNSDSPRPRNEHIPRPSTPRWQQESLLRASTPRPQGEIMVRTSSPRAEKKDSMPRIFSPRMSRICYPQRGDAPDIPITSSLWDLPKDPRPRSSPPCLSYPDLDENHPGGECPHSPSTNTENEFKLLFKRSGQPERSRLTKSAGDFFRSKLLYLSENGVCRREPLSCPTLIPGHPVSPQTTSVQTSFHRDKIRPKGNTTLNERLSRAVLWSGEVTPDNKQENSRKRTNRKQEYLEEIRQSHLTRRTMTKNSRFAGKPLSAPPLRSHNTNVNNNNNNSTRSDPLIGMFDWSRMARLRARLNGHVETPDMDFFRDQVKQKKDRAKRLLLVITRIFMGIQHWSSQKTARTAAELQWFTLNSSAEAKTLAFNKELFTKDRAQAKVPDWAVQVMDKLPGERTESDCRRIHALMRGLKSFEKFTERIQLAMCRSLRYENIDSMRVILRKGHIGLNFYFIYSGSVFINVEDVNAQGQTFVKTETVLSRGDSFGELALLKEVARTATVSARETCELLTVDKEVFSKLCPQIFDKELEEKIEFIKTVPLFKTRWWSIDAIRNLCFQAFIREYKANRIIVPDSTTEDWMYICMAGKCKIIRHLFAESEDIQKEDEEPSETDDVRRQHALNLLSADDNSHSQATHRRRSSMGRRRSVQKDKTRLLQSMALAATDSTEEKGEESATPIHALTLSSLLSQSRKHAHDKPVVFLDIGNLSKGEVFDLDSILDPKSCAANNRLILVSSGASLLRVKKTKFLQNLNEDSMQHARNVARKYRYPSDHVLLTSYHEKEVWNEYKGRVVKETLSFRLDGTTPEEAQLASSARRAEIERRTERLLLAFSQTSCPSDNTGLAKLPVDINKLGAFILGTAPWRPITELPVPDADVPSLSIPTVTITS